METVDAIRGALRLLSPAGESVPDTLTAAPPPLPTAPLLGALSAMVDLAGPEDLAARHPDLRPLLAPILDWAAPSSTRATKVLVKAIAQSMRTPGEFGLGYAATVEMVGYLSLWAPYLDADRLARVAAHASSVTLAYAPTSYILGPSGQLGLLVGHYDQARREQLAVSLWNDVHEPRWYDLHVYHTARRRRRRMSRAERETLAQRAEAFVQSVRVRATAKVFVDAIRDGSLTYCEETAAAASRLREPAPQLRRALVEAARAASDEDVKILAARIPWLAPAERPESPVARMLALALAMNGGPAVVSPYTLPERPREFRDLVPQASREAFAVLGPILRLDGMALPGLPGSRVRVLASAHEISENADFMGNCTRTYVDRCMNGSAILVRIDYGREAFNVAYRTDEALTIIEAKARFNHPIRERAVREGIDRLRPEIARLMGAH